MAGIDILNVMAGLGATLPTVQVEPYLGTGPFGPKYGPAQPVECWRADKRRLVRNADGREVVAETTLYMRLSVDCPPESRVTVDGRARTVITAARHEGAGLPLPECLEVTLT